MRPNNCAGVIYIMALLSAYLLSFLTLTSFSKLPKNKLDTLDVLSVPPNSEPMEPMCGGVCDTDFAK